MIPWKEEQARSNEWAFRCSICRCPCVLFVCFCFSSFFGGGAMSVPLKAFIWVWFQWKPVCSCRVFPNQKSFKRNLHIFYGIWSACFRSWKRVAMTIAWNYYKPQIDAGHCYFSGNCLFLRELNWSQKQFGKASDITQERVRGLSVCVHSQVHFFGRDACFVCVCVAWLPTNGALVVFTIRYIRGFHHQVHSWFSPSSTSWFSPSETSQYDIVFISLHFCIFKWGLFVFFCLVSPSVLLSLRFYVFCFSLF